MPRKTGSTLQRGTAPKAPAVAKASGGKKAAASKKAVAPVAEQKPFSFIEVRVGRLPGPINSIALNGGRTVADALAGASLVGDGYEIRVNGTPAQADTELAQADTVLLIKMIRGN